jgi:serine/threonine-protein kinase HipA
MKDILRISTSAGGARPKAIIAYNEKTKEVRSGQARAPQGFEHWLLKLDGVSDTQFGESQGYGRVEMAYYNMAVDAGITMMPSMLLEENGRAHFMTKRFDRSGSNTKHHVQTFCAIQHYDFNLVGNNSYEQLFQTARQLNLSAFEQTELFRRMVFNVIMKNCDDHTKNFSFILKETESWALSPAYDVCHAYRPDSVWVSKHALSINGKREGITRHDLLAVAENVGVKKPERIIDLINDVARQWLTYAKSARVFEEKAIAIKKDIKPL